MNGNTLKNKDLEIQFCGKGEQPPPASERLLPVLIHSCPPSFSTVEYFEVSIVACIVSSHKRFLNSLNMLFHLHFLNNIYSSLFCRIFILNGLVAW